MGWIALRMLMHKRGKYLGMIAGTAVASMLVAQQLSIFCGIMLQTASQVYDVRDAAVWVMDPNVQFVEDVKRVEDARVHQVRGVPGVQWAVAYYKGLGRAQLASGVFHRVILLGLDDPSLAGAPAEMIAGRVEDLRRPDAIIVDEHGYERFWPGEPIKLGRPLEMNDRRAVVVGVCKASPTFQAFPIVYTRYSLAVRYTPLTGKMVSFVLADLKPGAAPGDVCRRIARETGLSAYSRTEFAWITMSYFLRSTGILINFGITVSLGFIVGTAVAGQTFYLATVENLPQFGALKAMGVGDGRLAAMVLAQATVVAMIGYGLGVGAAALTGYVVRAHTRLSYFTPWQVLAAAGGAVLLIVVLTSLVSLRRVLALEPAIVFRG